MCGPKAGASHHCASPPGRWLSFLVVALPLLLRGGFRYRGLRCSRASSGSAAPADGAVQGTRPAAARLAIHAVPSTGGAGVVRHSGDGPGRHFVSDKSLRRCLEAASDSLATSGRSPHHHPITILPSSATVLVSRPPCCFPIYSFSRRIADEAFVCPAVDLFLLLASIQHRLETSSITSYCIPAGPTSSSGLFGACHTPEALPLLRSSAGPARVIWAAPPAGTTCEAASASPILSATPVEFLPPSAGQRRTAGPWIA